MEENKMLTVEATIKKPIEKVWQMYNDPNDITKWNNASDDWHTTKAKNNLEVGGEFSYRMEAKDGSAGFDFGGVYSDVQENKYIAYEMGDGRKVEINFERIDENTSKVTVSFDPENENPLDFQKQGWQSILDNFKNYTETN